MANALRFVLPFRRQQTRGVLIVRKPQQRRPKKTHRVIPELGWMTAARTSCQSAHLIMPFGARHFDLHSFGFYALLSIMRSANSVEAFLNSTTPEAIMYQHCGVLD